MTLRGRHWVALALAAFAATAALVVWRQTAALAAARRLARLETALHALESTREARIAAIRHAESRAVLVPLVESRLHLRVPQDSDIVILQDPRAR